MKRSLVGLIVCGLMTGCSFSSGDDDAGPIATMGLVSFDACADALNYLKSEGHDRVGPWGLGYGSWPAAEDGNMAAPAERPDAAAPSYSGTNVQEIGVDEPDVIKTNGRLIVTVAQGDLRVVDITTGVPRQIGRLPLPTGKSADATLLLSGDRAVVLMRGYSVVAYDSMMPIDGAGKTTIMNVDLSDPAAPVVDSTLDIDGNYLDARMVDGIIRLVVSSQPSLTFPMGANDWNREQGELIARNQQLIAKSTIDDWLPSYRLTTDGTSVDGALVSCDQLTHPKEFAGFSTISVLTFNPADGLSDGDAVGVLSDGDTVYASADRLYVATTRWGDPVPMGRADLPIAPSGGTSTDIHAFDISGHGPARYVASGDVNGRTLGRYAMSEYHGVLRVATTISSGPGLTSTESQLVTLAEKNDELVQIGHVGGIGKGENIYAVRYFGPTGYVVTFRQIDPLYVLDLADPTTPQVRGKLKVTGYSSYLHDIGGNRLVGVGQEATEDGRGVGAQISLFNVDDPSSPTKLDGLVMPNAWLQAEWDTHAFLYWPETQQLVVPFQTTMPTTISSGALVARISADSVSKQGLVTHSGTTPSPDGYVASLSRSLVVDSVLYTLWNDGLQANNLDDLALQGSIPFT
jgi:hypothetical protein